MGLSTGFGAAAIFLLLIWGVGKHDWVAGAIIGGIWMAQALIVPAIFERRERSK